MTSAAKLISSVLLIMSSQGLASAAGGMDSGGGGLRGFESNPWFIGRRDVTYCVEVNPDFPDASSSGVRRTVANAFNEWRRFLDLYRLGQRTFNLSLPDGLSRGLDLTYVPTEDCSTAALKILVGVVDSDVSEILKKYPPKTFAFAHLTSDYDFRHYTRDNKGLIWIGMPETHGRQLFPPYDKRPILPLVLLHEIGHTLGIGHLDRYSIMGADIFEWMSVAEEDESLKEMLKKFSRIDNPTPLISFARPTKWQASDGQQDKVGPLFAKLTGRNPVGNVDFRLETMPSSRADSLEQSGAIFLRDAFGKYKFDVQFKVGSQTTWPYCKIKLAWQGSAPDQPGAIRSHGCLDPMTSDYLSGVILDSRGHPLPSKVTLATRQKILTAFGGAVEDVMFNIHLKMAGTEN